MRPQKVENKEVLRGLITVLRSKGYDGSSLKDLAEATGLKKASLYHRFPGGKEEMALTVLEFVDKWIEKHIYNVLVDSQRTIDERLDDAIKNINHLYGYGNETCLLRALSMDNGITLFGHIIKASMKKWIKGFTLLGIDSGLSQEKAEVFAMEALIKIQGSLIVGKGLDSSIPFENVLQDIQKQYLNT